jgi:hypothetical protein
MGFSDHRATASIWHRLLNLGFRIPAGAGTDAMANYASLRGPVGTNRTYVPVPAGPVRSDLFLEGLRAGRSLATNGPLLDFTLGGAAPGDTMSSPRAPATLSYTAALRSIVPIEHLEIVCNGRVAAALALSSSSTVDDLAGVLTLPTSAWCTLQAWNEGPTLPILDSYPYATTSPIYVEVESAPLASPEDAAFFVGWVDRLLERAAAHPDWNTAAEREETLASLRAARAVFLAKLDR